MTAYGMGTPEGARDRLFDACRARRALEERAAALFARRGCREVMTPALEYYELFARTGPVLPPEPMIKLIDLGGRILVMRPDSTTPTARVASARLRNAPLPLRLYYIQDVYRFDAVHHGKRLETRQAGVETIGAAGLKADLELLSLAAEALRALGAENFRIELGHAALFQALFRALEAPATEAEALRALIEQKNFASLGDRLADYDNKPVCRAIECLCRLFGGREVFSDAGSLGVPEADEALAYLRELYTALARAGLDSHIQLDLGLVHQMDYYTGLVFRGYAAGIGHAVLAGGRYDNLLAALGRPAPGAGFALDIDALCEIRAWPEEEPPRCLIHFSAERLADALLEMDARPPGSCELSPCDTLAESRALAAEKGMKTLLDLDGGGEEVLV